MKNTFTKLPVAVVRYFAAANQFDATLAAECFTRDAKVQDESGDYVGHDAIRAWIGDACQRYRPMFTVLRASTWGNRVELAVAVSGRFPGSPVTLDYELWLRRGKISVLTIE